MTTREEIRGWIEDAQKKGATHLIVVVDTFDHEDYPVAVMPEQNVRAEHEKYNGKNMQRVMEVYSLTGKHDIEKQLKEHRANHFD